MTNLQNSSPVDVASYLTRVPERLVLQGYRYWAQHTLNCSVRPLRDLNKLYNETLGNDVGSLAADGLLDFVRTLGMCARCPLRMHQISSPKLCTDETLVLGLISGIQHGDDEAVRLCLDALSCQSRCSQVSNAAGTFALFLKAAHCKLLPIPSDVVISILQRQGQLIHTWNIEPINQTIH